MSSTKGFEGTVAQAFILLGSIIAEPGKSITVTFELATQIIQYASVTGIEGIFLEVDGSKFIMFYKFMYGRDTDVSTNTGTV